jgi:hypothetical protein
MSINNFADYLSKPSCLNVIALNNIAKLVTHVLQISRDLTPIKQVSDGHRSTVGKNG